jgi:hypothetical protein
MGESVSSEECRQRQWRGGGMGGIGVDPEGASDCGDG